MATDNLIRPAGAPAPAESPAPAPDDSAPAESDSPGVKIPSDIAKIPAFQAVLVGQPAAFSTPVKSKNPDIEKILGAKAALEPAGLYLYRSLAGDTAVLFNGLHLHPDVLQAADKAGKLLEVAPPFETLEKALAGSPDKHPILTEGYEAPTSPAMAPPPAVPQSGNVPVPPAPAASLNKLQGLRDTLLKPGAPTSGAKPGAGRVLNALAKPVI